MRPDSAATVLGVLGLVVIFLVIACVLASVMGRIMDARDEQVPRDDNDDDGVPF